MKYKTGLDFINDIHRIAGQYYHETGIYAEVVNINKKYETNFKEYMIKHLSECGIITCFVDYIECDLQLACQRDIEMKYIEENVVIVKREEWLKIDYNFIDN